MREYVRTARCGTRSGYVSHRKFGEEPCDACREASAAHRRKARQGKPTRSERLEPVAPGSWADRASCRHINLNMSMPDHLPSRGDSRDLYVSVRRRMCLDCPVYDDCRTWALTVPDPAVGMIAAGMTPKERRNARRNP